MIEFAEDASTPAESEDPHAECLEREKALKRDLERANQRVAILERKRDAIRDALSNAGESS